MCVCVCVRGRVHVCATQRVHCLRGPTSAAAGDTDVSILHLENRSCQAFHPASTMARLDQVITSIVNIFIQYADDEGNKGQLNKEELKKLLEQEIQSPELKDKISANDIEEAMEMLDKNHDGEVNFREFCRCVSDLAKCYYHKQTGRGGRRGRGKGPEEGQGD
ncbi:protein S100-A6 isoform X1 [Nothobranchius furzeri]|uniref:EF-hand domain-containing protein n=2 Tax=Nothobranchius furzeri TaxID=105023 RepID=A0A1A8AFR4_NOTFU